MTTLKAVSEPSNSEMSSAVKGGSVTEIDIVGRSGRYQTAVILFSFYSSWFLGTAVVSVGLLAPLVTLYWDGDESSANRTTFSSDDCKMDDVMALSRRSNSSSSSDQLVYYSKYSTHTLTQKFNLVCERSWLVSFANFMCMIGQSLGNIILGLTERFGRRKFIVGLVFVGLGSAVAVLFAEHFTLFAVATLLFRASSNQASKLLFLQAAEIIPLSRSPYVGIFSKSGLLLGQTLLVVVAWLARDWFYIQLFQTLLFAVLAVAIWYILESPAWLAVRGKHEEARRVLETVVQRNGRDLQEETPKIDLWLEEMKNRCGAKGSDEKGSVVNIFQNRVIALITGGLTFTQFACGFLYNGLVMNAESFGSSLYLDLTVSNGLSLVSVFVTALLMSRVSSRMLLASCFLLEGISCMAYPIFYSFPTARTVLSILCRCFISPIIPVSFVYISKVFPTSVRAVGSGFVGIVAFILCSPAPFTKEMGERTSIYVPFILFALLSLASAFIYYKKMPETRGMPVLHTVDEFVRWLQSKQNCEVFVMVERRNVY